jgi:predicted phage terminase large subunit-like protein
MIFMPPGHAKSTYASVLFPAWYVGKNPRNNLISASFNSTLAERFGRKVRDQVSNSFWPFPEVQLSGTTKSKGEWETNLGGEYFAAGVGGGITGRRLDLGLIDDPIKGREDADSITIREKTWDWYLNDFRTRLKPRASIVLIQTRWHEDDLAGRILPEDYAFESGDITARDGEVWRVINLPALAEDNDYMGRQPGQPLWPDWGYDLAWAEQERRSQTQRSWTALYQQRPAPDEGDYFRREWIRYYDTMPTNLKVYGASDYAVTADGGDYTEHGVFGVDVDDNVYVLDWWYGQTDSDIWIEQLLNLMDAWKPIEWGEESGQIAKGLGPFIDKRQRECKSYVYRKQWPSVAEKATRAQAIRGRMAQGKVYFPKNAPWLNRLVSQLLTFPAGKYDDAVDVLSLCGRMLNRMLTPEVPREEPKPRWFNDLTFNELRDMNAKRARVGNL